jgi:hypothetical protein
MPDPLLTASDVAALCQVSPKTICERSNLDTCERRGWGSAERSASRLMMSRPG